ISNPSATEPLGGVQLNDPVPAGLVAANPSGSMGCTISGDPGAQVVSASGLTLGPGESLVCEFDVSLAEGTSPVAGQVFINVATARSTELPVPLKDVAWVTTKTADLDILKTSGPSISTTSGSYTILVTNTGDTAAGGIAIDD